MDIFTPFRDGVLQLSACVGLTVIVGSLVWTIICFINRNRQVKL